MQANTPGERLVNGIYRENPTFILTLGMCPTLAVTTSAINGLGMGLTTTVVLALANLIISLLRNIIPDKVRIPAFIVVIASFVTMVELLLQGFVPFLYSALGIYIPLIVVNCIILGRAEAYAYKFAPLPSLFDGLGMGLGFTLALTIIGAVREILGTGKIFGTTVLPESVYTPIGIFVLAPGAFFVLAMLTALMNRIKREGEKKGRDMSKIKTDSCDHDCLNCDTHKFYDPDPSKPASKAVEKKEAANGSVPPGGKPGETPKEEVRSESKAETKEETKAEIKEETKEEAKEDTKKEVKEESKKDYRKKKKKKGGK